jgi:hypothetical protein
VKDSVLVNTISTSVETKPYVATVSTTLRDSTSDARAGEAAIITDNTPTGTMDTVITTTIVDTVTKSFWRITDNREDGVVVSSDPAVLDRDSLWVVTISTSVETNPFGSVAIEQTKQVQESTEITFAPNPVMADGEIFFTTPSDVSGSWSVTIYDVVGNSLDQQEFESNGGYIYRWDLRNSAGVPVATGTYVAIITVKLADGSKEVIKRTIGVKK